MCVLLSSLWHQLWYLTGFSINDLNETFNMCLFKTNIWPWRSHTALAKGISSRNHPSSLLPVPLAYPGLRAACHKATLRDSREPRARTLVGRMRRPGAPCQLSGMPWTMVDDPPNLSELLSLHLENGICRLYHKASSVTFDLAFGESRPALCMSSWQSSWGLCDWLIQLVRAHCPLSQAHTPRSWGSGWAFWI